METNGERKINVKGEREAHQSSQTCVLLPEAGCRGPALLPDLCFCLVGSQGPVHD